MIQRRERLRFALEARGAFRIGGKRRGQDLDRDLSAERGIRRAEDLAHPAFADLLSDFVDADARAWGEGQGCGDYTRGLRTVLAGVAVELGTL
jgi:hypothetical protein